MRYASIDVLRTLAIILMVTVHFLENLSGGDLGTAGFGAPMFGFLVGVSYRIWSNVQLARGRNEDEIARSTFRRGVVITTLGFLFNVIVWLPADTFNWDVLTLIGSAFFVLWMIRETPPAVPIFLAALVFLVSPILRMHSDYDEYWLQGYFDPDWNFSQVALGYLVNGYFPIFPWLIFPLVGYVVGGHVIPDSPTADSAKEITGRKLAPILGVGFALLGIELLLGLTRNLQTGPIVSQILRKWTMFPASVEYLVGMTGGILVTLLPRVVVDRWSRWSGPLAPRSRITRTMSQYSLSIYVFHHLLHIWPLWLYGLWNGQDAIHYWRIAMLWQYSAALILPAIAFTYLVFRWVDVAIARVWKP